MDRRTALKLLGTIVCCMGAREVMAQTESLEKFVLIDSSTPYDFFIDKKSINNLIIERIDGSKLTIPFSEIIEALQE